MGWASLCARRELRYLRKNEHLQFLGFRQNPLNRRRADAKGLANLYLTHTTVNGQLN
ncbi:MAG: hypothetical protein Q7T91_08395 [Sulfuricurvum sp.]|nr:hypothetical protein [Sulfuricurvum sp.]